MKHKLQLTYCRRLHLLIKDLSISHDCLYDERFQQLNNIHSLHIITEAQINLTKTNVNYKKRVKCFAGEVHAIGTPNFIISLFSNFRFRGLLSPVTLRRKIVCNFNDSDKSGELSNQRISYRSPVKGFSERL